MKQQQADAGQDLDAGWDEVVTDVAASAAQSSAGENQATIDDLDAGWELDVLGDSKPLKDMGAQGRNRAKGQRQATAPIAAPVQTLSKKARREIERQNRMHSEKRKSEAKLQRKEQRRAGRLMAAHETPAAVPASAKVKKATNVTQPSRSKPKPQANQPHREAAEPTTNGTQVNKAEARSRWPWLALVVIAIILVAVKWFFF